MICSVAVFAATNSEPYVAISTVACFLEYQSTGILLTKWRHPLKQKYIQVEGVNASRLLVNALDG